MIVRIAQGRKGEDAEPAQFTRCLCGADFDIHDPAIRNRDPRAAYREFPSRVLQHAIRPDTADGVLFCACSAIGLAQKSTNRIPETN
jgi:hypothetical protein